jgi:hypothetical protein
LGTFTFYEKGERPSNALRPTTLTAPAVAANVGPMADHLARLLAVPKGDIHI